MFNSWYPTWFSPISQWILKKAACKTATMEFYHQYDKKE
jgi:hypothetical protein